MIEFSSANQSGPYQLPPEWAKQQFILLTWPRTNGDWGRGYQAIYQCFLTLAEQLHKAAPLIISVSDPAQQIDIQAELAERGLTEVQAKVFCVPSDDIWVRDHGPITVKASNGRRKLLDFAFNGWGHKYPAERDNWITQRLHKLGAFQRMDVDSIKLVIEGGAVEVDGAGTLLSRLCCLPERNPDNSVKELSQTLCDLLGQSRIIWLEHGYLEGDDTDAHIDTLARFTSPNCIAYQGCDDPQDPHFENLQAMANELANLRNSNGEPYRLVELPWPKPVIAADGKRLPASYANFLISNDCVFVPSYGQPENDRLAVQRLQKAMPSHHVESVDCLPLIQQYGGLHCATMQIPL